MNVFLFLIRKIVHLQEINRIIDFRFMKKLLLLLCLMFSTVTLYSQLTATGTYKSYFNTYRDIDYLFVFNGINSATSIKYNGNYTTINWYKFSDLSTSISNQNENFNVEDATGYVLDVDGVKTTIWVIDYTKCLPVFNSFLPENSPATQCDELKLDLQANVPLIQYKSLDGITHNIDRKYTLTYNTKEWNGSWSDKVIAIKNINLPKSEIYIATPPLCDTKFKIEGDQFAQDLQISPLPFIESPVYSAVAVEGHITTTAATRTELQEGDRPENSSVKEGSAPLDIMFESNANVPGTDFYQWQIFKENVLLFSRSDQAQRYTFTESGIYTVKLTVGNSYCNSSDSVTIKVSTSEIQVPYVFTPNGDGINDEFRVAYKSILSFKCWVFNRWGRKVYFWTDPQKGWDGTINGKAATPGAYFYFIEYVDSEGKKRSVKGNINLLRGNQN